MTTYLGKSCSFCLPRVPFVDCRQFMYLVISLLVLRAGYGIWLYQFLIIAYLFTLKKNESNNKQSKHNMPFQNALSNSLKLGHKILEQAEQAEHLWKEHVHHPLLTFLDSNNHTDFTVTHYYCDSTVSSASDCRSGNTSSSLSSAT